MPKFIPCAVCGTPVEIPARLGEVRRAYCPDHIGAKPHAIGTKVKTPVEPEPVAVEAPPKPKAKKRGRPKKKPASGSSGS